MEKQLLKGIKEIISEFPKVGELLNRHGIGCVTCSVGTCRLKDIIEIHNLPKSKETELMSQIEKIIYPDRKVKIQDYITEEPEKQNKGIKYSPPIKKLVDEHMKIKAFLNLIPKVCEIINQDVEINSQLVLDSVNFIMFYADKYHHAKEEDILFRYADETMDIIKVMLEDHTTARGIVKAVLEALEKKDKGQLTQKFSEYRELLTQHIRKEDEILYPWIERKLSISQVGELFEKFNDVDQAFDMNVLQGLDNFIKNLE